MNKPYALEGVQTILAYPFKQEGWQSKFAIGLALFFANYIIPIIPSFFLAGYFAKIMHSSINDDESEPSLPAWDNWGDLFSRGAKVIGASMVYMFPALVLIIGGYVLAYVPLIMESISSSSRYGETSSLSGLSAAGMMGGFGMLFLGLILYFPLILILPLALTHVIAKNSFVAAFHIRTWVTIFRANFWGFVSAISIVTGVYMIAFMFAYMLYFTVILCVLMPIAMCVVYVYVGMVTGPLLGEAYRKGVANLAEAASA